MKPMRNSSKEPTPDKSASVHDLINQALRTGAGPLDLSGRRLTELPESIGQLTQLQSFYLHGNQLTALPESVGRLTELKNLNVSHNQLTELPESIGQLTQLQRLDLSGNQLRALPECIGRLTQLQRLDFSDNQLMALPESIGQWTQLRSLDICRNLLMALLESIGQLTQLRQLYLSDNRLKELPESIGQLTQLQQLYLSDNLLQALPESIGQLASLQDLKLAGNQLKALPGSMGRLSRLQKLDLAYNQLKTIPEFISQIWQLQHLDVSENGLDALPESMGRLRHLQSLNLSGNQLGALPESFRKLSSLSRLYLHWNEKLGLPSEVLGPSWAAALKHPTGAEPAKPSDILEYYFRVRIDQRPLNEAKLILIGRGGAGKTCTVDRLVHDHFDWHEKKTEGIQITEWKLRLRGYEDVRLNIWDFGGQEIMHATHQFFLTHRSLYLLVLSGREGGEDLDAEYWLKLIESFGGDSPVIIVLNKIKEHPFDLNRRGLQQKYPAIRDFVKTDCEDGTGREKLLKAIERETDRLGHLRDAFPTSWFSIKDRLTGMKENFLTFDEYRTICTELGEEDPKAQGQLAFYLHSLGIALNYKDDPRLHGTHVLNPHWVTKGIYTILNSETLEKQKGEIRLKDLSSILQSDDYPLEMHRFLLDLMKKFELCFTYPDDDTHYLIPELLDKEEPEASAEFNPEDCLNFQYHYPVLPEGLLPRFIVRTHQLSEGLPRWRTGVILEFEENRALVKADLQDKKVFISVSGPELGRRRLLSVIRSNFVPIHRAIRNLNPEEMVPLPGYPTELVRYRELFVMEKSGTKSFTKVVGDEVIELNVDELLNGVALDGEFLSRHESHGFDTALLEQRGRADPSSAATGTSIHIKVGGQHMGDIHVGQAGAVGSGAHAHDITFNQIWNQIKESVDLPKLAAELTTLREEMKKEAVTVEHDAAVGDISKAEQAAKAGDGTKAIEYLKSAGKWAFDTATKIGTTLAAEVLKKSLLNP
jgi:internalin A